MSKFIAFPNQILSPHWCENEEVADVVFKYIDSNYTVDTVDIIDKDEMFWDAGGMVSIKKDGDPYLNIGPFQIRKIHFSAFYDTIHHAKLHKTFPYYRIGSGFGVLYVFTSESLEVIKSELEMEKHKARFEEALLFEELKERVGHIVLFKEEIV